MYQGLVLAPLVVTTVESFNKQFVMCHLCALAVPAAAHVVFCGQSRQTRLTHWTSHWHLKQLMAVEGKSVPAAEE